MKLRVAIICGGPSSEHEISCLSANSVLTAIDRSKFEPLLIGITKSNKWVQLPNEYKFEIKNGNLPVIPESAPEISKNLNELKIDVAFPVLHGAYGEDGEIQKLFESIGVSYTGNGVSASATAMDKSKAKEAFKSAGLKVVEGFTLNIGDEVSDREYQYPVFVKPASGGSSRGTHKVKSSDQLAAAVSDAFKYDKKVLVEKAIVGREIEVAVLEKDGVLIASVPGEIKIDPKFEFYDFEAKYLDNATTVIAPAELPQNKSEEIKSLAIKAFKALGCSGLARVDFFYANDGEIFINELNTLPGFTATSVFPKLMSKIGISYPEIITELINGAKSSR